jgi:hypothetical protein
MPIKNVKCKINNSTKHSNNNYKSSQHQSKNLINLITRISQASKNRSKSQSNLPARLIMMKNMSKKNSINRPIMRPIMRPVMNIKPMTMNIMQKPQSYSKTISSTYSNVMKNGHSHSEGKKVINDSTKPYVQIDELHNGHIDHYMVPRNTISTKPTETIINISTHKPMILEHKTTIKKSKKTNKTKTSKKTTKSKKSKKNKISKISKISKKTTKSKKSKTSKKNTKSKKSKTSKKSTKSK